MASFNFKCYYHAWEVIVICMGCMTSLMLISLVLWILWWLRLEVTANRRLIIQKHRALTLGVFFLGQILAFLSCVLASHLLLAMAVIRVWSFMSHVSWTLMEGWQVYRSLVRKEQADNLKEPLSWLGVICIYIPASFVIVVFLILKGSTFVPIILFYETLFMGMDSYSSEFWDDQSGKSFIIFFLILPSTAIMVIFNLTIICLVLYSIRQRSEILRAVNNSSQIAKSPNNALVILTFSTVLGLNMVTGIFAFSPSFFIALLGKISSICHGGFFIGQFILCNKPVRIALMAKSPWIANILTWEKSGQNSDPE